MTAFANTTRLHQVPILLSGLLLAGLYFPSSLGGHYSMMLWGVFFLLLVCALLRLVLRQGGLAGYFQCANSMILLAILLASTIISPFPEYRWGGLVGFAALSLLYVTRLRDITGSRLLQAAFLVANLMNVSAGIAVIVGNDWIRNALINHYSAFYPGLLQAMMDGHKPVLSFGSHSTGAFFTYFFFFLSFETYKLTRKSLDLWFSICYAGFCLAMQSFTGISLFFVVVSQFGWFFGKRNLKATITVTVLAAVSACLFVYHYLPRPEERNSAIQLVTMALSSESNGFLGRFSGTGNLRATIEYFVDRPFAPVGVGYRSDLFFGDSGVIECFLRGSVFLVVAVYMGFYKFLKHNLLSQRDLIMLFVATLAFEMGFSSLTYIRSLYLLPVFIVYLNDLRRSAGESSNPK